MIRNQTERCEVEVRDSAVKIGQAVRAILYVVYNHWDDGSWSEVEAPKPSFALPLELPNRLKTTLENIGGNHREIVFRIPLRGLVAGRRPPSPRYHLGRA
jgi:hypothetical protein